MPALRSASAVTGPAVPPPTTMAVSTLVMVIFLVIGSVRAEPTWEGNRLSSVCRFGPAPSQVWFEVRAPARCWRTAPGPSVSLRGSGPLRLGGTALPGEFGQFGRHLAG